jgi:transposase InsO family protein
MDAIAEQPLPLGDQGQSPRRDLEQQTRTQALVLQRWAAGQGVSLRQIAGQIGLAEQTLSDWSASRALHLAGQNGHDVARGRPHHAPSVERARDVQELLEECRGRLGLPALKGIFLDIPRNDLTEIRKQYLAEHEPSIEHLIWTRPGSVWAADFTEPDLPIDGIYPYILSIRDLASTYQLLALPVIHCFATVTIACLSYLFAAFGPALVFKSDNGSPLVAGEVQEILAVAGVTSLPSPPMTPRYNGAIEAGIGALKTRTLLIAASHGRSDQWTCDDVEAARLEANDQARPRGRTGPSPNALWNSRSPITPEERSGFLAALALAREEEALKMIESIQTPPGCRPAGSLNLAQRATVARRATRRVLVDSGLLLFRRTANLST